MQKRLVLDQQQIAIILKRFCHQLIENHDTFENTVLLGLQPRGPIVLDKIVRLLEEIAGVKVPFGYLDATFHRDDFRRRDFPLKANETKVYRVLLNASYLGKYYLPGLQAEAMYDNTYVVRTKGQWIEIVRE